MDSVFGPLAIIILGIAVHATVILLYIEGIFVF